MRHWHALNITQLVWFETLLWNDKTNQCNDGSCPVEGKIIPCSWHHFVSLCHRVHCCAWLLILLKPPKMSQDLGRYKHHKLDHSCTCFFKRYTFSELYNKHAPYFALFNPLYFTKMSLFFTSSPLQIIGHYGMVSNFPPISGGCPLFSKVASYFRGLPPILGDWLVRALWLLSWASGNWLSALVTLHTCFGRILLDF